MSSFCSTKIMDVNFVYTPDQDKFFQGFLSEIFESLTNIEQHGTFNDKQKKHALIKLSRTFEKASRDDQHLFKPTGTVRHNLYSVPLRFLMNIPSQSFEGHIVFPLSRSPTTTSKANALCTAMARCRILATQQQRLGMQLPGGKNNVIGKLTRFEKALRDRISHNPTYFDLYPISL